MTEDRKCYNCAIDLMCQGCNEDNSKWQPIAQEKPMEKIQMTEEQAIILYRALAGRFNSDIDSFIYVLKQAGYIRKSAVEEAEEEYIAYKEGKNCFVAEIVMDKMYLAIQELKSEIARGGNDN